MVETGGPADRAAESGITFTSERILRPSTTAVRSRVAACVGTVVLAAVVIAAGIGGPHRAPPPADLISVDSPAAEAAPVGVAQPSVEVVRAGPQGGVRWVTEAVRPLVRVVPKAGARWVSEAARPLSAPAASGLGLKDRQAAGPRE